MARRYEFYVLVARTISHSFAALTREILLLPLEHKIHIFSPPCNILYIYLEFPKTCFLQYSNNAPSTIRYINQKSHQMFSIAGGKSFLRRRYLKTQLSHRSFWICVERTDLRQGNHLIIVASSFSKGSVLKIFSVHTKTKDHFSGLKSVFEVLCCRDGVDGTPNRRNNPTFSKSSSERRLGLMKIS